MEQELHNGCAEIFHDFCWCISHILGRAERRVYLLPLISLCLLWDVSCLAIAAALSWGCLVMKLLWDLVLTVDKNLFVGQLVLWWWEDPVMDICCHLWGELH